MNDDDLGLGSATVRPVTPDAGDDEPRGAWPSERFVLTLWALLTLAAAVAFLAMKERDAVDDPVQKAARGEVTGLGPLSLLRADPFAAALEAVRAREPQGRLITLRVDPTRLNAQVRTPDFVLHYLDVDAALAVHQSNTSETSQKGLAFTRIDPAVPERMLREVNARTGTRPQDVDYLTISVDSTEPARSRWVLRLGSAVRLDKRGYTARLDGRDLEATG